MVVKSLQILAALSFMLTAGLAPAQMQTPQNLPRNPQTKPKMLETVDVIERLGDMVATNLTFTNERGEKVLLSSYFKSGRPVILNLAYYECPMLCTLVLNGVSDAIAQLDWRAGSQYQLVTVSINPKETAAMAASKQQVYLDNLKGKVNAASWSFLVGDEPSIKALAKSLGFNYAYDEKIKQYAHPAVSMILTPEGRVSRYLYGISHKMKNLRLSLVEASTRR